MPVRPDLASLELFLQAVELRSLSKAAERSHIALAAASRRIALLEDLLGVEVLERSSRGVQPTPAGVALVENARQVLQQVGRLTGELSEYAKGVRGRVRLHSPAKRRCCAPRWVFCARPAVASCSMAKNCISAPRTSGRNRASATRPRSV